MKKFKCIVLLMLFSTVLGFSQSKKWTLEECVSYALKNNISIQQTELGIESANIDKKASMGNLFPSLNAGAAHSWNIGLNQNITTGLLENQTIQYTSASLSSNVVIYNGLQNVNRIYRAKLSQLAAQYQLSKMQEDVSLNIANAFLEVLFNKERLKVQQAQLDYDEKQLKRSQELVNVGVLPKGDLLDIKATVVADNQKIVMGENALLISKLSLTQLLHLENLEDFDVEDSDLEIPHSSVMLESPKTILEKAEKERIEIKIAQNNLDLAQRDIKIARGAFQPSMTGFYSFSTRASYSDRIVGIGTDGKPILTGPLPVLDQFSDNKGHNFGLQLSIPIFNGFSVSNNVAKSKINFERNKNAMEQAKLDLETNVYKAIADAKGALKSYESSVATVDARQEAFNYVKEKYEVGIVNSFEFNQSQTLLTSAISEMLRNKYDYLFKVKIVELYFGIPIIKK